jgi:hypothetical protein
MEGIGLGTQNLKLFDRHTLQVVVHFSIWRALFKKVLSKAFFILHILDSAHAQPYEYLKLIYVTYVYNAFTLRLDKIYL